MNKRQIVLPPSLDEAINAEAERRDVTRAAVIRWALTLGLRTLNERATSEEGTGHREAMH